jgi:ribosomal protein L11 methylase PrmA
LFYRLGPSLVLRSRWQPYLTRPGERILVLQTASVFPPGHPTTLLSLDLLKETLAADMPSRLLDVGCVPGC